MKATPSQHTLDYLINTQGGPPSTETEFCLQYLQSKISERRWRQIARVTCTHARATFRKSFPSPEVYYMSLSKSYLIVYNIAQWIGWSLVLFQTLRAVLNTRDASDVYAAAGPSTRVCQGFALLETLHTATGIVRGSAPLSFLQWFGRSNVLYLVLHSIPELWTHWAVPVLFIAWALADMARYPYYAASLIGRPPGVLTWLRYSAFIPLYPIGMFLGEMPLMYRSLPYLRERHLYSLSLPNSLNFAFHYHIFVQVALYLLSPLALSQLYMYMLAQRRKRLQGIGASRERKSGTHA